jgi:hypothetical protein
MNQRQGHSASRARARVLRCGPARSRSQPCLLPASRRARPQRASTSAAISGGRPRSGGPGSAAAAQQPLLRSSSGAVPSPRASCGIAAPAGGACAAVGGGGSSAVWRGAPAHAHFPVASLPLHPQVRHARGVHRVCSGVWHPAGRRAAELGRLHTGVGPRSAPGGLAASDGAAEPLAAVARAAGGAARVASLPCLSPARTAAPPPPAPPAPLQARAALFLPGGKAARMLSRNPTVLIVNDTAFAHGGLLPAHGADGTAERARGRAWGVRGAAAAKPRGFC